MSQVAFSVFFFD